MKKYFLLFILSFCFIRHSFGSMYPPDYILSRQCISSQVVDVCQIHTMTGFQLEIIYSGYLIKDHWGAINSYVNLNSRDSLFKMFNVDFKEHLIISSSFKDCVYCPDTKLRTSDRDLNPKCQEERKIIDNKWHCTEPTQDELKVFYYALNEKGQLNTWNIEVAFFFENFWDSNLGNNYKFTF